MVAESYSTVWMSHSLFIHSSAEGQLGGFLILALMNNAAINIHVHAVMQTSIFNSFRSITKSGIAGSYDYSMFKFLRNGQTVFHNGCSILPSP